MILILGILILGNSGEGIDGDANSKYSYACLELPDEELQIGFYVIESKGRYYYLSVERSTSESGGDLAFLPDVLTPIAQSFDTVK